MSRMQKTECFYYDVMTILYYLQWFNNKNDNRSGMLEITITRGRRSFFLTGWLTKSFSNNLLFLGAMEDFLAKMYLFKDLWKKTGKSILTFSHKLVACLIYQEKKMHFSIFFHKILVFTPHSIESCWKFNHA